MSNRSRTPGQVSTRDRLTVLVVDGDRDTLEMYAESLRLAGFTPLTASEPGQALAQARAHRPDAVVCDIRLQRCFDGLELMARLHADPGLSGVPLLALTGFVRPTYKHLAERAGCVAWLVKPCEPDLLVAEIQLAVEAVRTRILTARPRPGWTALPPSTGPLA